MGPIERSEKTLGGTSESGKGMAKGVGLGKILRPRRIKSSKNGLNVTDIQNATLDVKRRKGSFFTC